MAPQALLQTAPRRRDSAVTNSQAFDRIPPDRLEQIFERIHRLDGARSRDSGGSGLGLAIARAITEARGGAIHVESSPGHGATFRVELPGYGAPRDP